MIMNASVWVTFGGAPAKDTGFILRPRKKNTNPGTHFWKKNEKHQGFGEKTICNKLFWIINIDFGDRFVDGYDFRLLESWTKMRLMDKH